MVELGDFGRVGDPGIGYDVVVPKFFLEGGSGGCVEGALVAGPGFFARGADFRGSLIVQNAGDIACCVERSSLLALLVEKPFDFCVVSFDMSFGLGERCSPSPDVQLVRDSKIAQGLGFAGPWAKRAKVIG